VRGLNWIDSELFPPCAFIAGTVSCPVMDAAQGDSEFVAHLSTERARLHEAKMVRIGGLPSTDETRLLGDKSEMLLIAIATRLSDRKGAFVDTFDLELSGRS
jgi:hypothetical protein